MKFVTEDHAAQIDILNAPGVPDGYNVKLSADADGLTIEVERPHGEGASTWDFFEFSVPVEPAPEDRVRDAAPDLLDALERLTANGIAQGPPPATHEGLNLAGAMAQARAAIAKATNPGA